MSRFSQEQSITKKALEATRNDVASLNAALDVSNQMHADVSDALEQERLSMERLLSELETLRRDREGGNAHSEMLQRQVAELLTENDVLRRQVQELEQALAMLKATFGCDTWRWPTRLPTPPGPHVRALTCTQQPTETPGTPTLVRARTYIGVCAH